MGERIEEAVKRVRAATEAYNRALADALTKIKRRAPSPRAPIWTGRRR